jgi:hypothetical protein
MVDFCGFLQEFFWMQKREGSLLDLNNGKRLHSKIYKCFEFEQLDLNF